MTLCFALRATDGIVAVSDGMTSFGVHAGESLPPPPRLDTRKLCLGPEGQSWVLMYANRDRYPDNTSALEVTEDVIGHLPDQCANEDTLETVAGIVWGRLTELEVLHRPDTKNARDIWTNGFVVERRFEAILAGYAPAGNGDAEVWMMMADGYAPRQIQDHFVGIGAGVDRAAQLMTDSGALERWYRESMAHHGSLDSLSELDCEHAEQAAMEGLQLDFTHERGGLGHLDHLIGGIWRCAQIKPGSPPQLHRYMNGTFIG